MNHVEEHILELYVLKSDLVEARRGEIEAHLAECSGCRALKEEIAGFYTDLEKSEAEMGETNWIARRAIVRRHEYLEPYQEPFAPPVPYRPTTLVGKLQHFVRRHPVAAGAGTFAAMGVFALLMSSGLSKYWRDKNPTTFQYNMTTQAIVVYNNDQQILWDLKVPSLPDVARGEKATNAHFTILADLDHSGRNSIITTLTPLGEDDNQARHLRIYDRDKVKTHDISLAMPVHYLDRAYSPYFVAGSIMAIDDEASNNKHLYVIAENLGRSPSVVVHLDHEGKKLGAYWNFGGLESMQAYGSDGGARELIIGGKNDAQDTATGGYAFIAVLDPSKIVGEKKSTASPGFSMETSDAEAYYIRLPLTDMEEAGYTSGMTQSIMEEDSATLRVNVGAGYPLPQGNRTFNFEYFFDRQMRVLRVKSTNTADSFHAELASAGIVKGTIDKAYLDALKDGVRYWDGREWQKERTMVRH